MARRRRRTMLGLGLLGLCGLVVGWAATGRAQPGGGSLQEKLEQLQRLPGPERQRFLEEQAAREGKFVMYGGDDPVLLRAWTAGFKKRYPRIDAQFVRTAGNATLQKSMSESQAGRPVADLVHVAASELPILERAGMVARYVSPESSDFDATFRDPSGAWTVYWYDPAVVGFNTNLVKKADVPTTLEGLANPALKGKLARVSSAGADWVAGLLKARGEAAGMDILRKIAANEPRIIISNTAMGDSLTSGQIAMGFDFRLVIAARIRKLGAPVDWIVPDPLFILPLYQVFLKDAPHPYATVLAYDWLLSKEGQAPYMETGNIGPRKDMAYPDFQVEVMNTARKDGKAVISMGAELMSDSSRYIKIFEDLFIRK
jgi:iron(III) transport system substrate-binding protein